MINTQNFARTNYVIKAEERKQRSINKCLTIYGKLKCNQQTDLITKHTVSNVHLDADNLNLNRAWHKLIDSRNDSIDTHAKEQERTYIKNQNNLLAHYKPSDSQ